MSAAVIRCYSGYNGQRRSPGSRSQEKLPIAATGPPGAIQEDASQRDAGNGPVYGRGTTAVTGIYRGWPIAGVAFFSSGLAIGMAQYAFGVFIDPLEKEFGWSRTEINFSLTLGLTTGFLSPLVGRWMDRFGARPVMAISLLFLAAGFLLRAVMTDLWQFYLFSLLLFMGFPGATVLPAGRLIAIWFARTRGRMMGIVTAGNNFGGLTMVPLAAVVVSAAGWRWGYAVFGVILILIAFAAWYIVRDHEDDVAGEANRRWAPRSVRAGGAAAVTGYTVRQALRMRTFYFIAIGLTSAMFTYSAVLTQIIPHLEAEGFSGAQASLGLTIVAAFGIASKLIFGRLSETITARWATVLSLVIQSIGLFLFIIAGGSQMAWVAVVVFGMGFGGLGALIPLTVAEAFGVRHFGSILGLVSMAGVIPVVVGPLMAGVIFDATGTYDLAFGITIGLFVSGAIFMTLARRPRQIATEPLGTAG